MYTIRAFSDLVLPTGGPNSHRQLVIADLIGMNILSHWITQTQHASLHPDSRSFSLSIDPEMVQIQRFVSEQKAERLLAAEEFTRDI